MAFAPPTAAELGQKVVDSWPALFLSVILYLHAQFRNARARRVAVSRAQHELTDWFEGLLTSDRVPDRVALRQVIIGTTRNHHVEHDHVSIATRALYEAARLLERSRWVPPDEKAAIAERLARYEAAIEALTPTPPRGEEQISRLIWTTQRVCAWVIGCALAVFVISTTLHPETTDLTGFEANVFAVIIITALLIGLTAIADGVVWAARTAAAQRQRSLETKDE